MLRATWTASVSLIAALIVSLAAHGQTTAGAGTVIVLPLAAHISTAYKTTVFVRNLSVTSDITLNVRYYQSDSATPPGDGNPLTCTPLVVQANRAVTFDLGTQCTFSSPLDNFGQIILEDSAVPKVNTFLAYSRTEVANGNGFSVEGFPVGNFSRAPADSLGLKKTLGPPNYRSNCFVGALNEPVNYQILLVQGQTGVPLASVSGSLGPYHSVRILDVFTAAGLAGAFANVRATFSNSLNSAMIAFCTLETSDNGSADFRVAKSDDAADVRQARLACYGMDSCGNSLPSVTNPATITDVTKKNIHYMIIAQPDFVTCSLVADAPTLAALEITLRGPGGDPISAPVFPLTAPYNVPPYTSGGGGQNSFVIYTGEKSTVSSGATTRWFVDVQRQSGSGAAGPFNYGIVCRSGNGVTVPWLGTTAAATP